MAVTTITITHPRKETAIQLPTHSPVPRRRGSRSVGARAETTDAELVRVEARSQHLADLGSENAPNLRATINGTFLDLHSAAIERLTLFAAFRFPYRLAIDAFHTLIVHTCTRPAAEARQQFLLIGHEEQSFLRSGDRFFETNRPREAAFCWRTALPLAGAVNRLAALLTQARAAEHAMRLCEEHGTLFTYGFVARRLAKAGLHDEAIDLLDHWLARHNSAECAEMKGVVLARAHRHAEAASVLTSADTPRSLYYLAILRAVRQQPAAALAALKRAVAMDPRVLRRARGNEGRGDERLGPLRNLSEFQGLLAHAH